MIVQITDTDTVRKLFEGWEETLIYSALEGCMGRVYADDALHPTCAMVLLGLFSYYAGVPNQELVRFKPADFTGNFVIMGPGSEAWAQLIETCYPDCHERYTRYAIKKETSFDISHLQQLKASLPPEYHTEFIDENWFSYCKETPWCNDFVNCFADYREYRAHGLGVLVLNGNEVCAGTSSYSWYKEGIEIEIVTKEEFRQKGLATAAAATLILECLQRELYPSWDAANLMSVGLAQKLGYEFDHEYPSYRVFNW